MLLQLGRRSLCVVADVTQENEVKDMVDLTVKELGELNVCGKSLVLFWNEWLTVTNVFR